MPEPIVVDGRSYEFIGISMGNPHAIYYMDEIDDLDLEAMGPAFETHERFPERTNSEFIQVVDRSHLRMRVWEREAERRGLRHGEQRQARWPPS